MITSFGDEDWTRFDQVWMGNDDNPATEISIRASALRAGNFEIRTGYPTGTPIGTVVIPATTGGSKDFHTYTVTMTPTSGVKKSVWAVNGRAVKRSGSSTGSSSVATAMLICPK